MTDPTPSLPATATPVPTPEIVVPPMPRTVWLTCNAMPGYPASWVAWQSEPSVLQTEVRNTRHRIDIGEPGKVAPEWEALREAAESAIRPCERAGLLVVGDELRTALAALPPKEPRND